MRTRMSLAILACALATLGLSGCGSDLSQTEGMVTLDGQPLAGARVVFEAPGLPTSVATTDEQGRYVVQTGSQQGMVPGTYRVSISAYETRAARGGLEAPIPVLKTPRRYNSAASSGLTAEISEGRNRGVDYRLTSDEP